MFLMRVVYRALLLVALGLAAGICSTSRADHPPGVFNATGAGPINFLAADTLRRGCWGFGGHTEYVSFDPRPDGQLAALFDQGLGAENVDYLSMTFVSVAYGLTENLTVVGRLPYVHYDDIRQGEDQGGVTVLEDQGDADGFGDFLLLGVLKVWESAAKDVQVSAIFGFEAPTGRTDAETLQGERFAFEHQLGSGSWDPLGGVAVSLAWDRLSFHANATYLHTTEGRRGTDLGDVVNYNGAIVYRLAHEDRHPHPWDACPPGGCEHCLHGCCCHRGRALDLIVELNGVWQEEHTIAGALDRDSGGHLLWFAPGLRYTHHEPWCVYSSCGIPIGQEANGANREAELRIVLGAIVNW
jgi:hypothetical protein